MALNAITIKTSGPPVRLSGGVLGAPLASQTVPYDGKLKILYLRTTSTASVVTIVRPLLHAQGDAVTDFAYSLPASATSEWIPLNDLEYFDPVTRLITVQFSVLTGITGAILTIEP